jgi:hypothetical protein
MDTGYLSTSITAILCAADAAPGPERSYENDRDRVRKGRRWQIDDHLGARCPGLS